MSKTIKSGLEYFSFDVDFFSDEKVEYISALFGIKGEIILIKLLTKIYRHSYFIEFSEDSALLFAKNFGEGISPEDVKSVVAEAIKRNFFNKNLYDEYGILTSTGIQKRYFEAVKRRKKVDAVTEYLLIDTSCIHDVNIFSINVNISKENANIFQQSKVKESKVKERSDSHVQTLWIKTFGRNPKAVEIEETITLIEKFGEDKIFKIFKEATLKGFKNLGTLIEALDKEGNIKPKENFKQTEEKKDVYEYQIIRE